MRDGGPAFPIPMVVCPPGGTIEADAVPSMSLFELYAGLAMQAVLTDGVLHKLGCVDGYPKIVARAAEEVADAMVAMVERRKGVGHDASGSQG